MRASENKPRPAAVGMMFGLLIGSGIGALVFAFTGNAVWFALGGVGVVFGLGIGAAVERQAATRAGGR